MEPDRDFGVRSFDAFAHFDPALSSWRTSLRSLFGDSHELPPTWPRAGIVSHGRAIALPPLAPRIAASEFSSSRLPTMTASEANHQSHRASQGKAPSLTDIARTPMARLPTPLSRDAKGPTQRRGQSDNLCNLLPTATRTDANGSRRVGLAPGSHPGTTLTDASRAPAKYHAAIAQWEKAIGRPAPPIAV